MSGIQFRRYELKPGSTDDFLAWWRQVVAIRERCGFRLLFGFLLRENDEFISAWAFDGDLSERESVYYRDRERRHLAEVAQGYAERYADHHGQDARTVADHPGFTRDTHITLAEVIASGALDLDHTGSLRSRIHAGLIAAHTRFRSSPRLRGIAAFP